VLDMCPHPLGQHDAIAQRYDLGRCTEPRLHLHYILSAPATERAFDATCDARTDSAAYFAAALSGRVPITHRLSVRTGRRRRIAAATFAPSGAPSRDRRCTAGALNAAEPARWFGRAERRSSPGSGTTATRSPRPPCSLGKHAGDGPVAGRGAQRLRDPL
jgi:hypothetical protein